MHRKPAAKMLVAVAASCLVVIGASGAASIATSPVPVKASTRDEVTPAAGGGYFTWAKSRRGHPNIFDVWVQQDGQSGVRKVNPPGTSAFGGGIDGTRLVYQQVKNYNSDLRLFDLATGRRTNPPPGTNTKRWEWGPTISGDWLLFARGVYRSTQQAILRNLVTGEQRVLDTVSGKRGSLTSGQVNGGFAVWGKCVGNTCDVFRYDIASGTKIAMPRNGRVLYAPSVVPSGTTYYVTGETTCGDAQLVRTTTDGRTFVLSDSGSTHDIGTTYAVVLPGRPPNAPGVRIYFEWRKCSNDRSDIYSLDDTEPVPPPGPAGH